MKLTEGIYEQLITCTLEEKLQEADQYFIEQTEIEPADAARILSEYLLKLLQYVLNEFKGKPAERLQAQLNFTNQLITDLAQKLKDQDHFIDENLVATKGNLLKLVHSKLGHSDTQLKGKLAEYFPVSGLQKSSLFTGSHADLNMDTELIKDILSADRIYWVVSFIRWSGVRIYEEALRRFLANGGQLQVITTTYVGATEAKAVQFLADLPNTEVKVSYNTQQERLHAKSYIFERNTGYDTAYIGSSNLSYSAMTRGLEWNMRVTSVENTHIIRKAKGTFETYWSSPDFEDFRLGGIEKLQQALSFGKSKGDKKGLILPIFKIHPYPYQQQILDRLEAERSIHHRYRNLVVAATGTGKTVISAFDFLRYKKKNPSAKLLFVAHRKEILEQSQRTFAALLKDANFGELWVGEHQPEYGHEQLFVSVQTLNNQRAFFEERLGAHYYDFIIVDEAHHGQASSYRFVFDYFEPEILLGLTATPERMDGRDIREDFDHRISAEIRLPDAMHLQLLTPFQYFVVTDDSVDLSRVAWKNGGYDKAELSRVYTGNDQRVQLILDKLAHYLNDYQQCCALGFCTTKEHAQYMSGKFQIAGLAADYLTSDQSREHRQQVVAKLRSGKINYLFVVDLFNEGVDIPEVDTVLFLRPTESLTVFLQQLGRGLRLQENKECLTVLDFVGQVHQAYDFTKKFRALVGKAPYGLTKEITQGFPHVTFGCSIIMEQKAQQVVLEHIRAAVVNRRSLVSKLENWHSETTQQLTLSNFLSFHDLDIRAVYKVGCWTQLKLWAGMIDLDDNDNYFKKIVAGLKRLITANDQAYLQYLRAYVAGKSATQKEALNRMFHYLIWDDAGKKLNFENEQQAVNKLKDFPDLLQEFNEIIEQRLDQIDYVIPTSSFAFPCQLTLHAQYSRTEILAAFGDSTFEKKSSSREGVLSIKKDNIDLLFVTLDKSERDFSTSTMYEDYAISDTLFHWQSQNSATPLRGVGLSYIEQKRNKKNILLFVREKKRDEYGLTMPFTFLGPVAYRKHRGEKPMSIEWALDVPMPASLVSVSKKMG